jgi:hypothetical protein
MKLCVNQNERRYTKVEVLEGGKIGVWLDWKGVYMDKERYGLLDGRLGSNIRVHVVIR